MDRCQIESEAAFLRLAAREMRLIATQDHVIASQLLEMAGDLEAELLRLNGAQPGMDLTAQRKRIIDSPPASGNRQIL